MLVIHSQPDYYVTNLRRATRAEVWPSSGVRLRADWDIAMEWLQQIEQHEAVGRVGAHIEAGGLSSVRGCVGSSGVVLAAAMQRRLGRPVLIVVAHLDDADEAVEELQGVGVAAARLPAVELAPGESGVNLELVTERLMLVRRMRDGGAEPVIVAPIQSLMQLVPGPDRLGEMLRVIRVGDLVDARELAAWLMEAGYVRVPSLEEAGQFSIRGGIIDIFPPGGAPSRIDLFGDEVEQLNEIDLETMGSDRRIEQLSLAGSSEKSLQRHDGLVPFMTYLDSQCVAMLVELIEITEQGRSYFDRAFDPAGIIGPPAVMQHLQERCHAVLDVNQFSAGAMPDRCVELPVRNLPDFPETTPEGIGTLIELAQQHRVVVFCENAGEQQRMQELLGEAGTESHISVEQRYLHRGFVWGDDAVDSAALVPYHELLHRYHARRRVRSVAAGRALDTFLDLQPGDYVVHRDHGIARFLGLRTLSDAKIGSNEEFLVLEFAGNAKLNVPVSNIDLVQRYIGAFKGSPELSTPGGRKWGNQKERVKEAVRDLASEMLRMQAVRESLPGIRYPADTTWQHEFEAEFPYEETEDQLAAIAAVKRDMTSPRPMDRLVCGDVGFGKTEVAIRAAFKAVEYGRQVAVLVPTTVLAEQHERTFRERFADYPFRIESLSRFRTRAEQNATLKELAAGRIDIVIGTHRLLSADVKFADLGLVVIDEEQRFGVEHKNRLLGFRTTADVLTLSATPIPRTLHMAMLGIRDISSLTTAPMDRRATVTEVINFNERRIRQAVDRELAREGQVFFVHNRVHNIQSVADDLQRLVPDARILVGHGQMPARQLERVMLQFMRRQADVLVCTTIIESGIDIPTANTMFINDAHIFGLSDLHQLRGRVGRYKHRAYCYLMLPGDRTISEVAVKRLRAIESFSMLGAGFKIALRDLEIRGAGNLLGAEQSGHIAAVGYEMYCHLLEEAVRELKNDASPNLMETTIDIGITGSLPKAYIPSDRRRMDAYRRINQASDMAALDKVEHDLVSAYGDLPVVTQQMLEVAAIRIGAAKLGIRTIARHDNDIIFRTTRPAELETCMAGARGTLRFVSGHRKGRASDELAEVYYRPPKQYLESGSLLTVLRRRLTAAQSEAAAMVAGEST